MEKNRLETAFFIALLGVALVLSWLVFQPYLSTFVIAAALTIIFGPVYKKLMKWWGRPSFSASMTVFIAIAVVFIPLAFFGFRIFAESTSLYTSLTANGGFDFGPTINGFMHANFPNVAVPTFSFNVSDAARQTLNWFIQNLGSLFSGVAQILFIAFLSLLGLYFLLKDGERLKKYIIEVVPLSDEHTETLMEETRKVMTSVIRGTLIVAILQGLMAGISFLIFGIPNPAFWGTLAVIASLVPIVGTWLVLVPSIAYLFFAGNAFGAIGLAIWSLVIVNIIYNVISPQLIHRGIDIHPYVILLSVLGGIALLGPIGFLVGPFIISLLISLLNMYPSLMTNRR